MHKEGSPYERPDLYWEQRLASDFSLSGAGVKALGALPNRILYQRRSSALEEMLRRIGQQCLSGKVILEIGCGTGFYTAFLHKRGVRHYIGFDLTMSSVRTLSQGYPMYKFVLGDIGDTIPDEWREVFDIAIAADVLFHLVDDRKWNRAITNIARCLRSGGFLIATEVMGDRMLRPGPHVRLRPMNTYDMALRSVGLELVADQPILPGAWRIGTLLLRLGAASWHPLPKVVSLASILASKWFAAVKCRDSPSVGGVGVHL